MKKTFIALSLISIFLFSCAKRYYLPPPEPVTPYEGFVTVEVLKEHTVFNKMRTVQSEMDVEVYRERKRLGKFSGVFLFKAPDAFRIRIFDPFGMTALDMVSFSSLMQIYIPSRNVLYEGISHVLGMPRNASYTMEEVDVGYALHAFARKGAGLELISTYYFDPVTLRNTGMTAFKEDMRFTEIRFGEFWGYIPLRMRMEFFNGFVMDMTLDKPEFNGETKDSFFMSINHKGKRIMPLQELIREPLGANR